MGIRCSWVRFDCIIKWIGCNNNPFSLWDFELDDVNLKRNENGFYFGFKVIGLVILMKKITIGVEWCLF